MGLQIEEECVQLDFLESNHLEIVLVKRLLQTASGKSQIYFFDLSCLNMVKLNKLAISTYFCGALSRYNNLRDISMKISNK